VESRSPAEGLTGLILRNVLHDLAKRDIVGSVKCLANARDIGSLAAAVVFKGRVFAA